MNPYDLHQYKDKKSIYDDTRSPGHSDKHSGYITLDGVVAAQTLQCCHCQQHWIVRVGSGEVRGFCRNCMQVTCGKEQCLECIPFMKKLDMIEAEERKRREVASWLIG